MIRSDTPAPATGFSGEVEAVGRPDDIEPEEDDQADTEELHPGVLTRRPRPDPASACSCTCSCRLSRRRRPQGGATGYLRPISLLVVVLTGLAHMGHSRPGRERGSRRGLAGSVRSLRRWVCVLVIASGWMLISRRKPAAEAETGADELTRTALDP